MGQKKSLIIVFFSHFSPFHRRDTPTITRVTPTTTLHATSAVWIVTDNASLGKAFFLSLFFYPFSSFFFAFTFFLHATDGCQWWGWILVKHDEWLGEDGVKGSRKRNALFLFSFSPLDLPPNHPHFPHFPHSEGKSTRESSVDQSFPQMFVARRGGALLYRFSFLPVLVYALYPFFQCFPPVF